MLNDPEAITAIGRAAGARVCVDAVSAFGTIAIALDDVWYASAVSGKGAGAFSGLAIVFYNEAVEPSPRLPRYLDLGLYARSDGVPFTHSSNLLRALGASIDSVDWTQRFERLRHTSAWLRIELRGAGFELVAPESHAAPGIVTIALPEGVPSDDVVYRLEQAGYGAASRSEYLQSAQLDSGQPDGRPADRSPAWIRPVVMSRVRARHSLGDVTARPRALARRIAESRHAAWLTHGSLVVLTALLFALLVRVRFWIAFVPCAIVQHRIGVLLHRVHPRHSTAALQGEPASAEPLRGPAAHIRAR